MFFWIVFLEPALVTMLWILYPSSAQQSTNLKCSIDFYPLARYLPSCYFIILIPLRTYVLNLNFKHNFNNFHLTPSPHCLHQVIIQMPRLSKFKVVLVGDQNVGKTSIISRFIHDSFEVTSNPTVGIDFVTKTMQVEGETLRLQLWDTAGQQRFRALIPSYVRDADVCLIVIDVSVRTSLEGVDKWLDFIRESRGHDAVIFMVGNKSDIVDREIAKNEIEEYAERNKYPFIEVSAKTGNNIHLLFRRLSERLIDNKNGVNKEPSQITSIPNKAPPPNTTKQNNISITKKQIKQDKKKSNCQC